MKRLLKRQPFLFLDNSLKYNEQKIKQFTSEFWLKS
jgi:hypothetical protein